MRYKRIHKGIFINRPNRFIAHIEIDGKNEVCHVKNTGRCKELLIPGTVVYVEESDNISRKTKYDLIAVEKDKMLVNMDSQVVNQVVKDWLFAGGLYPKPRLIQPEYRYRDSRIDFYIEDDMRKALIEVKGVTLEEDGIAAFPDAPTLRGVKHIKHLVQAINDGFEAYILFVIQFKPVKYFVPNDKTHPEFGMALREAKEAGVNILAYDCLVTPDSIKIDDTVDIQL